MEFSDEQAQQLEEILLGIEANAMAVIGAELAMWNRSNELKKLGVYIGYVTDPVITLTIAPRDVPSSGTGTLEAEVSYSMTRKNEEQ